MIIDHPIRIVIPPYGGELVNLCDRNELKELLDQPGSFRRSIFLHEPCDLELLACGAFSPWIDYGKIYELVIHEMRLQNGVLFPIPITLPVDPEQLPADAEKIVLCDARSNHIAIMQIEEVYSWDPRTEASLVLGTHDTHHPLVTEMSQWGKVYLSGEIKV
jgi:sulfate adenylyltransferase